MSGELNPRPSEIDFPPRPEDEEGRGRYVAVELGDFEHVPPVMLECRLKSGAAVAFAYAGLTRADFNPGDWLTLTFSDAEVAIHGRHLLVVYEGVTRHLVRCLWEADRPTAELVPLNVPVVTAVTVVLGRR